MSGSDQETQIAPIPMVALTIDETAEAKPKSKSSKPNNSSFFKAVNRSFWQVSLERMICFLDDVIIFGNLSLSSVALTVLKAEPLDVFKARRGVVLGISATITSLVGGGIVIKYNLAKARAVKDNELQLIDDEKASLKIVDKWQTAKDIFIRMNTGFMAIMADITFIARTAVIKEGSFKTSELEFIEDACLAPFFVVGGAALLQGLSYYLRTHKGYRYSDTSIKILNFTSDFFFKIGSLFAPFNWLKRALWTAQNTLLNHVVLWSSIAVVDACWSGYEIKTQCAANQSTSKKARHPDITQIVNSGTKIDVIKRVGSGTGTFFQLASVFELAFTDPKEQSVLSPLIATFAYGLLLVLGVLMLRCFYRDSRSNSEDLTNDTQSTSIETQEAPHTPKLKPTQATLPDSATRFDAPGLKDEERRKISVAELELVQQASKQLGFITGQNVEVSLASNQSQLTMQLLPPSTESDDVTQLPQNSIA